MTFDELLAQVIVLLQREERRSHDELMLNRAVQELARSLELDDVFRAIVEQAAVLSGLSRAMLLRQEPASRDLRGDRRARDRDAARPRDDVVRRVRRDSAGDVDAAP